MRSLTLANVTLPEFSVMIDSIRGVSILHGLHHLKETNIRI